MRQTSLIVTLTAFVLAGLSPSVVSANPAAMTVTQKQEVGAVDPVVERIRAAIGKGIREAKYNVRILNFRDYVLLQGDVDSEQGRQQIVSIAREASAKPIREELRLRPALTDDQIASQVRDALQGEYPNLADRVRVEVRDGVAYLSGDLRNHREADELLSTTLMVSGVRDIRSDITLGGRPYTMRRPAGRR